MTTRAQREQFFFDNVSRLQKQKDMIPSESDSPFLSANREDTALIFAIADRASALARRRARTKFDIVMDITACHLNGNPLRLHDMLAGDEIHLIHDILGIERHLDRDTGKLRDGFTPRFSR